MFPGRREFMMRTEQTKSMSNLSRNESYGTLPEIKGSHYNPEMKLKKNADMIDETMLKDRSYIQSLKQQKRVRNLSYATGEKKDSDHVAKSQRNLLRMSNGSLV